MSRALVVWCLVGLTLVGCSRPGVPMPADDASPEQVVRAYADAVHARDCDTADALVTDPGQSWCGDVDIAELTVTSTTREARATETGDGSTVTRVRVDITTRGGDESLPDGEFQWSYLLDRSGPGGAWRIDDQGMG